MIVTLNNIIHDLEQFTINHKQINEFGFGNSSNITTKDHNFVMLWLEPSNSVIYGHMMTLNFNMYILDILKQDLSNLKDVMSDTLQIGNDVVAKYWNSVEDNDWVVQEDTVSMEPFDHKFDDHTAGWIFRISIDIQNSLNDCEIPD